MSAARSEEQARVLAAPLSIVGRVHKALGSSRASGHEKAHVDIDDATRLAYVEVLLDEEQATTVGFLLRAVVWFDSQGNRYAEACGYSCRRVLSDNGSAYRSKSWREACNVLGLIPKRTRPFSPRTNGKAERFIKTLLAEWAYSVAFQTSTERNYWLLR